MKEKEKELDKKIIKLRKQLKEARIGEGILGELQEVKYLREQLGKLSFELCELTVDKLEGYSDEYKQGFMECKAWLHKKICDILEKEN